MAALEQTRQAAGREDPQHILPAPLLLTRKTSDSTAGREERSPCHQLWPTSELGGVIAVQILKQQPALIFPGFRAGWTSLPGMRHAYSRAGAWTLCVSTAARLKPVSVLLSCFWLQGGQRWCKFTWAIGVLYPELQWRCSQLRTNLRCRCCHCWAGRLLAQS